jgi:glutamate carboxypeptidase
MSPTGRILERVRSRRDRFVRLLSRLARAESPTFHPALVARTHAIMHRNLDAIGFTVEIKDGSETGGHLLARPRDRVQGRPFQLLLGHCDTVWPPDTISEMPVVVDENKLSGPGVFDMKAGLAMMVMALEVIEELGLDPPLTPVIFVNSDEEEGSPESWRHIEHLAGRAARVYVLEPALGPDGRLKTTRKGTGHFDVRVEGRASHAGLDPEKGVSAILELSHVIQELFSLNDPARGVSINVGTVAGGLRSNVIAPESRAGVDVRVPSWEDASRIEAAIRDISGSHGEVTVTITGAIDRGPLEATPRNQALWRLAKEAAAQLGIPLEQAVAGGASDGNITSQFTATLDGLGAVGAGAHAAHEHIDIDRTLERCALLVMLLMAPAQD